MAQNIPLSWGEPSTYSQKPVMKALCELGVRAAADIATHRFPDLGIALIDVRYVFKPSFSFLWNSSIPGRTSVHKSFSDQQDHVLVDLIGPAGFIVLSYHVPF